MDISKLKWFYNKAPRFSPGDEVWIASNPVYWTSIRTIPVSLVNVDDENYLAWFGYYETDKVTTSMLPSVNPFEINDMYVFSTAKEAVTASKWTPIKFSDDEWLRLIGDRDIEDSIEEAELSPCCAEISDIRDMLFNVKRRKGVMEIDREMLINSIKNHGDFKVSQDSLLANLLKQLNFDD